MNVNCYIIVRDNTLCVMNVLVLMYSGHMSHG